MKVTKFDAKLTYSSYVMIIGIPLVLMGLLYCYPEYTPRFTVSTFIMALVLIFILGSSLGNRIIGGQANVAKNNTTPAKQKLNELLPRILLAQLLILIVIFAFRLIMITFIPWNLMQPPPRLLFEALRGDLLLYGLHPWGVIFTIAAGMGITGVGVNNPKPAGILEPILGRTTAIRFGAGFDGASVACALFGIYILLTMAGIMTLAFVSIQLHLPKVAPTAFWIIDSSFVWIIFGRNKIRKWLLDSSQNSANIGMLLLRIFLAFVLLAFFAEFIMYLLPQTWTPNFNKSLFVRTVHSLTLEQQWLLLNWSWPILFAPLLGRWFATEFRGYSLRGASRIFFALPLLLVALLTIIYNYGLDAWANDFNWLLNPIAAVLISLLAVCILVTSFNYSNTLNDALVSMTPNVATKKALRLKRLFTRTLSFIGCLFSGMMLTGISSVFFIVQVFAIPMNMFWLLSLVALVIFGFKTRRLNNAAAIQEV